MLKVNYGIPVLEDNDAADLNKYSLEMADALKTQLDKFGNPLIYKGQVKTIQDLPSDTQSGDIYSVISENKNYIWNGTAWVEYASTIDLTELKDKTIVDKTTISGKTSQEGTPSPTNIVPIKNVNVSNVDENGYGTLTLNLQKDTDTQTVTLISKRLHEDDSVDENGFHYNRKTVTVSGTSATFSDAKENGNYLCSQKGIGTLTGQIISFDTSVTDAVVEYELATQENEKFNETNQTAWNTLEELLIKGYTFIDSSSDELQPTITLTEYTANEIYRENVEKFKELDNRDVYSTEEQIIGKWIDGKPLYRKTMQVPMSNIATSVSSGNSYTFFTGITNIGIAFVDECHSCFIRKNGTMANGISPAANWESEFVGILDDGRVQLYIGSAIFSDISDVVLTLIYTKR